MGKAKTRVFEYIFRFLRYSVRLKCCQAVPDLLFREMLIVLWEKFVPVGWEKLKQEFLSIFSNLCGDSHRFFYMAGSPISISARFLCLFSGTAASHVCCVVCTGGFPISISARFLCLFSGTATSHVCCVICTGGMSGLFVMRIYCGASRCAFPTLFAIFFLTGKPAGHPNSPSAAGVPQETRKKHFNKPKRQKNSRPA